MTGFAQVSGIDMGGVFAGGLYTIVTRETCLPYYRTVVKIHQPAIDGVTYIARFDSGDMINTLAPGNSAIMATFAGTNGLRVVRGTGR
jgi:hypothetical protein